MGLKVGVGTHIPFPPPPLPQSKKWGGGHMPPLPPASYASDHYLQLHEVGLIVKEYRDNETTKINYYLKHYNSVLLNRFAGQPDRTNERFICTCFNNHYDCVVV